MGKQKRSANTYQKIDTIFMRDENSIIMPYDEFVDPNLEWMRDCKWDCEEKIDGTNTRIECVGTIECDEEDEILGVRYTVSYKGKTDNANVPKMLMEHLTANYPSEKVFNALGIAEFIPIEKFAEHRWVDDSGRADVTKVPLLYTIYGEGYGVKIQGCGGNYLKGQNSFIGFDVKVGDMYLLRENRDEVLNKLGAPIVPYIGSFTVDEAIEFVRKGFKSRVAVENPEFLAEGLVCRAPFGIKNRRGNRLIFKVKTCDFEKYRAKYGTDEKVEQHKNTNYGK